MKNASATKRTSGNRLALGADGMEWDGHPLASLAEQYGTPLYVVNRQSLSTSYAQLAADYSDVGLDAEIFFSVKTNPVPDVLLALFESGAGAEVSRADELRLVLELGLPGGRVVAGGLAKTPAYLRAAVAAKVALLNIESFEELCLLEQMAGERDEPVSVGLRVNPGLRRHLLDLTVSSGLQTSHVGMRLMEDADLAKCLDLLEKSDALALHGITFHLGSGISSTRPFRMAVRRVAKFWGHVHRRGLRPLVLDIGGGMGIRSVKSLNLMEGVRLLGMGRRRFRNKSPGAARLTRSIAKTIQQTFDEAAIDCPRVFVEPGRALSGSTQILLLRVKRLARGRHDRPVAICDGGAMNLSTLLLAEQHDIVLANRTGAGMHKYDVVGDSMAPLDIVSLGCMLPELVPGDLLAVLDVGAYFTSMGNNFTGGRPAIVMIDNEQLREVRRVERYEDVFARDVGVTDRSNAVPVVSSVTTDHEGPT